MQFFQKKKETILSVNDLKPQFEIYGLVAELSIVFEFFICIRQTNLECENENWTDGKTKEQKDRRKDKEIEERTDDRGSNNILIPPVDYGGAVTMILN